jgi:hypothetical protein
VVQEGSSVLGLITVDYLAGRAVVLQKGGQVVQATHRQLLLYKVTVEEQHLNPAEKEVVVVVALAPLGVLFQG